MFSSRRDNYLWTSKWILWFVTPTLSNFILSPGRKSHISAMQHMTKQPSKPSLSKTRYDFPIREKIRRKSSASLTRPEQHNVTPRIKGLVLVPYRLRINVLSYWNLMCVICHYFPFPEKSLNSKITAHMFNNFSLNS